MNKLFNELRRRNVFRVAGVYAVVGWLLAQVAATLESAIGLPAWFDGFVVATLLIGFPIAMIFAWAFEMTPDGVKLTAAVPESESIAPKTGKTLDYIIVGGLALVGVMIIADRLMPQRAAAPAQSAGGEVLAASIAVLPFADMSAAGDQEYFSDGIAEEILNVLVRVNGLHVASRTSSFQFKGREIGIPEIAQTLNVRHVLEGSVRKSGDTLRITAQLIDTATDRHLWSDTYDRPLTAANIFAIQDEIAQAIVAALSEVMDVAAPAEIVVKPVTDNIAAYELYLQARELYAARVRLDEVEAMLAQAVEQDPEFADAWALRAGVYCLLVDYFYAPQSEWPEHVRKNREYAERALALDPDNAVAIAAIANARTLSAQSSYSKENFTEIIADFERARAINPRDGSILNWLGLTYAMVGEKERALASFRDCAQFEPFYAPCAENIYDMLASMGRMDEALAQYEHSLSRGLVTPSWTNFGLLAHFDKRIAFLISANNPGVLHGYRRQDEIYDAFKNLDADHSDLAADALRYAQLDNLDLTSDQLALLLTPLGAYDIQLAPAVIWLPEMKKYRQSPQFKDFMRSSGVYDYWREHGFPPQCKAAGPQTADGGEFTCE